MGKYTNAQYLEVAKGKTNEDLEIDDHEVAHQLGINEDEEDAGTD